MSSTHTSPVPPEQQASYAAIIDDILSNSDLNTVSAKRIRKGLQEKVDYDLTPHKDAITQLIMDRFDKFQSKAESTAPEPEPTANGNGHVPQTDGADDSESVKNESEPEPPSRSSPKKRKAEDESDSLSDVADSPPPKKIKKKSKPKPEAETDAQIAARLQKELNALQSRSTRGGGATKPKKPLKKPKPAKKKSAAKVKGSDDSELESSTEKPEREKKGGFHKPMHLSEPLAALVGESELSRPQTVKKIWAHIKEKELQNPSDKREIFCDEAMRAVFKQDKVHMFTMNKLLATHIHPAEEQA